MPFRLANIIRILPSFLFINNTYCRRRFDEFRPFSDVVPFPVVLPYLKSVYFYRAFQSFRTRLQRVQYCPYKINATGRHRSRATTKACFLEGKKIKKKGSYEKHVGTRENVNVDGATVTGGNACDNGRHTRDARFGPLPKGY